MLLRLQPEAQNDNVRKTIFIDHCTCTLASNNIIVTFATHYEEVQTIALIFAIAPKIESMRTDEQNCSVSSAV